MHATDATIPPAPEPSPSGPVMADPVRWATVLIDVLSAGPGGIALIEEDGELSWVDPTASGLLGLAPGFQAAADVEAAVHRARRRSTEQRTIRGEEPDPGTSESAGHTWWFPDGVEQQVLSGSVDSSGSRWRIWSFVDVTHRRAAEQHLRGVVNSLVDPLILLDAVRADDGTVIDFVFRDANPAFANYFGLPLLHLVGRTVTGMLAGSERDDLLDVYRNCVETGAPVTIDVLPYTHPVTGQPYWFNVRGARVGDGLWLSWHDVSEQHAHTTRVAAAESQQRAAVAESAALRSQLDRLLTASNSFVARWTDDGTITRLSESVGPLLGIDPDEMLGRHWIQTLTVEQDARRMAGQAQIRADGAGLTTAVRLHRVDGTPRIFEGFVVPAPGEEDTAFEAIFTDVTERRQAERTRSLMIAATGHELRTPLAFVAAAAAMLGRGDVAADSEAGRDLLRRMVDSSHRMARMADHLMDLERLEQPDVARVLRIEGPFDVGSCAAEAATVVTNAHGHPVEVRTEGVAHVVADRGMVLQAVTNLLDNAVRHSPAGTPVEVTVSGDGGVATVRVRDHGPGVDPAERDLVFEPFYRGPAGETSRGAGLGLAVVAGIAAAHGGRVWFEDPPDGAGVVAVLEIAAVTGHDPARNAERPSEEGR